MSRQRLFIAIDLPGEIAQRVAALGPHSPGVTFAPPERMHLTLAFFAQVEPATTDALKERLVAISFRAFFLPVVGLNTFSHNGRPQILWIGVGQAHPHLFQLHKRVNDAAVALGLAIEERAWTPHFTIARVNGVSKAQMNSFLKPLRDFDAGIFRVDAFRLYESRTTAGGPVHTPLLQVSAQLGQRCSGGRRGDRRTSLQALGTSASTTEKPSDAGTKSAVILSPESFRGEGPHGR